MSDTDGKKPLGLRGSRPGNVKQSFSHGRTKNVVVETKRKRVVVPKPGAASGASAAGGVKGDPSKRPAGISEAELERRMRALALARAREAEEAEKRAAEEAARAEERERRRAEIEAKEREDREREEALKAKAEAEERAKREAEEAARRAAQPAPQQQQPAQQPVPGEAAGGPRPGSGPRKTGDRDRDARADKKAKPAGKGDNRRSGKLTLNQALSGEGGRQRSMAQMKRKQERARQKAMGGHVEREKVTRDVQLPEVITVGSWPTAWPSASPTWSSR